MDKQLALILTLTTSIALAEGMPKPEPLKIEEAKAFADAFSTYEIDQDYAEKHSTYSTKSVNSSKHYSGSFVILCSKDNYWVAWNGEQLASWNRAKDCRGFGETSKKSCRADRVKSQIISHDEGER